MSNLDNSLTDWRNRHVNRDRKYEHLVKLLVEEKETAIFDLKKELMIFAAMIGYNFNNRKPLSGDKIPITLLTYSNSEDDGFIYLLALMDKRDATCLKEINLQDSIKIFEEYCNGGLEIIDNWFNTPQGRADLNKVDTLQSKLLEQLETNLNMDTNLDLDVEF
jgi:dnd system-associated protein 4